VNIPKPKPNTINIFITPCIHNAAPSIPTFHIRPMDDALRGILLETDANGVAERHALLRRLVKTKASLLIGWMNSPILEVKRAQCKIILFQNLA